MKLKSLFTFLLILLLIFNTSSPITGLANSTPQTNELHTEGGVFKYTISDGVAVITSAVLASGYDLIFPSTIEGYPVKLGDNMIIRPSVLPIHEIVLEGVSYIGNQVFSEYQYMSLPGTIPLLESLVSIGKYSFLYPGLHDITIPKNVSHIGGGSFWGVTNLSVHPESPHYRVSGTCLIETATNKVITAAINTNVSGTIAVSIPADENITVFGEGAIACAFYENPHLGIPELVIPEGVKQIETHAFYYVLPDALHLPSTLTRIDDEAFFEVLRYRDTPYDIYYNGTTNDWKKISIGSGNTVFDTYEHIHFLQNCETHTYTAESGTTCTVCGYVDTTPPTTTEAPTTTVPTTTTTKVPTTTTTTKAPTTTKVTTTKSTTTTTTTTKAPTTTVTDVVTTTADVTTTDATTVTTTDVAATTTADVAAVATTTTVTTTTATTAASTTPKGQFPWWVLLIAIPVTAAGIGVTIVVLKKKTPPAE